MLKKEEELLNEYDADKENLSPVKSATPQQPVARKRKASKSAREKQDGVKVSIIDLSSKICD